MKEIKYSENPISDIWMKLLKYSYIANIDKYLLDNYDENLKNTIAGSIAQSYEYFNTYNNVSINTSPLLLYYGCVNLLFAASIMLKKEEIKIKNHGLSLCLPKNNMPIGDTIINLSPTPVGAFNIFNDIFSNGDTFPLKIKIKDILSYIPEIKDEYEECYAEAVSLCIPIEIVKGKDYTFERIKIKELKDSDLSTIDIVDYNNAYIQAEETAKYIILRKKLMAKDIGIYSVSGQKYLIKNININKKRFYLKQIMAFFIGLYSFGFLSRYNPDRWYTFVQNDATGEKGLIEDFLSIAYRKLPNLILNKILNKTIIFTSNKLGVLDISKDYDPEDVKRIVKDEMMNLD